MKKLIITALFALTGITASAQSYGGWLTRVDGIQTTDILSLSQLDFSLGTARSSAMGGAVSALGADISAIGMNPAGLGMYRRNQFGMTFGLGTTNMYNDQMDISDSRTRFQLNSMGGVGILDQRSSGLVSSNLAFVYNKVADMNYRTSATFDSGTNSILDLFTLQLNGLNSYLNDGGWNGIRLDAVDNNPFDNINIYPSQWGAIMGYWTYGINPSSDTDDNTLYKIDALMAGAEVTPSFDYSSKGYVGQYDFTWGGNINNMLYLGVSVGFQDIWQEQEFVYSERYDNNVSSDPANTLKSLTYNQTSRTSGLGFNAKFGVIFRPATSLRLSLTYHTPTAVALRKEYEASMRTEFMDGGSEFISSGGYVYTEQSYYSPSRLIIGAAYTIGNNIAISADWERVWYGGIRISDSNRNYRDIMNEYISTDFTASDNFRIGMEVKTSRQWALRMGFGYYGSPLKVVRDELGNKVERVFNTPVKTLGLNYTGGLGYSISRNSRWDFTYVMSQSRYTMTDLYYYTGEARWADGMGEYTDDDPLTTSAPMDDITTIRHGIVVSYTYTF